MEQEALSEAKRAWILWQWLQQFSDLLWTHYEKEFLTFLVEEDLEPFEHH